MKQHLVTEFSYAAASWNTTRRVLTRLEYEVLYVIEYICHNQRCKPLLRMLIMYTVTFSDARKHFADTMSRVTNNAEPIRIMRRNAPDIVMVDAGEYEAMLETIYLFSNPANAAHLNESLAQLERGEVVTVDY